jgi:hypothetical protein
MASEIKYQFCRFHFCYTLLQFIEIHIIKTLAYIYDLTLCLIVGRPSEASIRLVPFMPLLYWAIQYWDSDRTTGYLRNYLVMSTEQQWRNN